jgi:hypothetical protein
MHVSRREYVCVYVCMHVHVHVQRRKKEPMLCVALDVVENTLKRHAARICHA